MTKNKKYIENKCFEVNMKKKKGSVEFLLSDKLEFGVKCIISYKRGVTINQEVVTNLNIYVHSNKDLKYIKL